MGLLQIAPADGWLPWAADAQDAKFLALRIEQNSILQTASRFEKCLTNVKGNQRRLRCQRTVFRHFRWRARSPADRPGTKRLLRPSNVAQSRLNLRHVAVRPRMRDYAAFQ